MSLNRTIQLKARNNLRT